jgi:hypothetical protein
MSIIQGRCPNGSHIQRLMSLSRHFIWLENFTHVEQQIGKAQTPLGKKIINENLQKEIALSPMDLELNKAKVTPMIDK